MLLLSTLLCNPASAKTNATAPEMPKANFKTSSERSANTNSDAAKSSAKDTKIEISDVEKSKAYADLRAMQLRVPLDGFNLDSIKGSFNELRGGTPHHASDFPAARNTAIHAVANGQVAKIFESKAGGHTVYQFDPSQKYIFYYAHLEKYSEGLKDGQELKRGDVIGYVGTSGNAPPDTPHLHFSLGIMLQPKTWWKTYDLDSYEVYKMK